MKHGIFYNSLNVGMCSIYEVGKLCYEALSYSKHFTLDYTEETTLVDGNYDFIIINQHFAVCNWITQDIINKFKGNKFCIVSEINLSRDKRSDPAPTTPKIFDHYIILDPTISETECFHPFPRPIPRYDDDFDQTMPKIPIIGSFGLMTPGKNWGLLIKLVEKEFETAIIRLNLNKASIAPEIYYVNIMNEINNAITEIKNPHIKVEISNYNFTQKELVSWCAQNTINVFLYNRHGSTGLAAVTDQAIASGRPLLITSHPTFRHIHTYIKQHPKIGIKEAIQETIHGVMQMKHDWSPYQFCKCFEELLNKI